MPEPAPAPGAEPGNTDALPDALAELAAETGLRFRLVLADDAGERVLHDSLGLPDEEADGRDTWSLSDGARLRASFAPPTGPADRSLRVFLEAFAPVLIGMGRDVRFYTSELATRYAEVELLTSAAGRLGAGVQLERGMGSLLADLAGVLGAELAEMWTVDEDGRRLVRFASSAAGASPATIDLELSRGPLAEACRRAETRAPRDEAGARLLVPVRRASGHGLTGALGVLRVDRPRSRGFVAAERKLVTAIAGQIGAAFENRRLAQESLERERMLVELELAHHLQLALLPEVADFADCADIAARCEPAESVGGDFYHLFRLGGGRLGVMLGDVSSHGYSAGLIMALTMSAASLVVREHGHPAEVLRGIHQELVRKLESTDMYMTLCYAVLDRAEGRMLYANAGHPHAFRIGPSSADRLEALNPPLGLAEFGHYEERRLGWTDGSDTLLMFTDGLGETMQADRLWSDDVILEAVRSHAGSPARDLLDRLFAIASSSGALPADDRTALILK